MKRLMVVFGLMLAGAVFAQQGGGGAPGNIGKSIRLGHVDGGTLPTPCIGCVVYDTVAQQAFITDGGVWAAIGGGGGSAWSDYMAATLTAAYNTNCNTNDHIKFDSVTASSGSNITLDTSTTYTNGNNVASIGRFTVQPGTYTFRLHLGRINSGNFTYVHWTNADTGTPFGSVAAMIMTNYAATSAGGDPSTEAIATFASATRVEARITYMSSCSSIGENQTALDAGALNGYPSAIIQKIN